MRYKKSEEMVVADILSRIYTAQELEKKRMIELRKTNQIKKK
ncbi:hypothetical protein AAJ76_2140001343 [Vairimorpha ceranae]|uniref:Uncharacterized protein n=1 Tax=Vairimorpha ceranae TaxID=40302 RepID=A0A0F9YM21_9MICR|nr:hypothetical protein AAJ76_2140001343 [Vairimorpha ceranae]KKO73832.1 hypothetical protein AAJ76_2140001343 [Vairimorpha ceranae]